MAFAHFQKKDKARFIDLSSKDTLKCDNQVTNYFTARENTSYKQQKQKANLKNIRNYHHCIINWMGNLIKSLFAKKLPKKQSKVVMLGLDGAGKTTILYALKLGEVLHTIPTIGFNVEELHFKTINFMVWDVGGQQKLRNLWTHYFEKAKALIYVIDSSDNQRVELAAKELNRIVSHPEMREAVVLVLANKRDVATMNLQQLNEKLETNKLNRNWAIYPVTAIKEQQQSGLPAAMEWLIENIDHTDYPKVKIEVG